MPPAWSTPRTTAHACFGSSQPTREPPAQSTLEHHCLNQPSFLLPSQGTFNVESPKTPTSQLLHLQPSRQGTLCTETPCTTPNHTHFSFSSTGRAPSVWRDPRSLSLHPCQEYLSCQGTTCSESLKAVPVCKHSSSSHLPRADPEWSGHYPEPH